MTLTADPTRVIGTRSLIESSFKSLCVNNPRSGEGNHFFRDGLVGVVLIGAVLDRGGGGKHPPALLWLP